MRFFIIVMLSLVLFMVLNPKPGERTYTSGIVTSIGTCTEDLCAAKIGDKYITTWGPVMAGQTVYLHCSSSCDRRWSTSIREGYGKEKG